MNQLIQSICSPQTSNFMSATSLLVKKQLADVLCESCQMEGEDVVNTHAPEFAFFVGNKVLKDNLGDQQDMQRKIIGFLNGSIKSVTLDVEPGENSLRLLGKTYSQNVQIKGKDDLLIIKTDKASLSYQSRDFGMLGKRWFNSSVTDTIFIGQDKLPLLISDGTFHFEKRRPELLDFEIETFRSQLQASFNTLAEISPSYYLWVILNLREILPLKRLKPNGTVSETSMLLPGHISITNNASVVETINMLVHETSHLYFHLLHLSVPLVDSNAPMYYSILKDTKRPLQNILLGYHAFVNVYVVLCLLNSAGDKELSHKELNDHLEHVFNYLVQLETALNQNKQYLKEESGLVMFETLKALFNEYR